MTMTKDPKGYEYIGIQ